ncbi:hypothetical protein CIG19_01265 [Enterobacterales bacterium CwR94]|nr:hypothetical protein CIG19_01265 [Enterobacterales bacterium CwR94]
MIISPPYLQARNAGEAESAWITRMLQPDDQRGYPVSRAGSWHGGIHINSRNTAARAEKVRAIADGKVVSFRTPASHALRDTAPLNLNGATDNGYVLLKHEIEIGSGENAKVVFYSLYMHLEALEARVVADAKINRKEMLGTPGRVDGTNAFHFQIFCDDTNITRLTGRKTRELDITQDGRTDVVYGDIHFYLPPKTDFYDKAPEGNSLSTTGLTKVHTSTDALYVSMTLGLGSCTMTTRLEVKDKKGTFEATGEALKNTDGENYEYNLYKNSLSKYKQSPSAGYELMRFGRVINTDHEKLVPNDAPLWMTVNYPGGKGVVNLALPTVKKFSDADFPHWMGWYLVSDDEDTNSQCNSAFIKKMQDDELYESSKDYLIACFPFEWDSATLESRFSWLKNKRDDFEAMSDDEYDTFIKHVESLSFGPGDYPAGKVWNFNPASFITHFRKNMWLESDVISGVMCANTSPKNITTINNISDKSKVFQKAINTVLNKYNLVTFGRVSHFLGQGAIESGYLMSMQEVSQEQIEKKVNVNGVEKTITVGGSIVKDSKKDESSELGHWYGSLASEVDNYFSGNKYNSKGSLIAGSYSWKNGNCGDVDAQKFRGRGFKMLTGLDTYSGYWLYRGWLKKEDFDASWWTDAEYKKKNASKMKKRAPSISEPHKITENEYNCIDTGGYFITGFRTKTLQVMDSDKSTTDDEKVKEVTEKINGADLGLDQRKKATKKAKELLNDEI